MGIERANARQRVVIEGVLPEIDGDRYAIKHVIGDEVVVEADIFVDNQDVLSACLCYRMDGRRQWLETPLKPLVNDRWRGAFTVSELGRYHYALQAWVDPFQTWRQGLAKKIEAQIDVSIELLEGAALLDSASHRARSREAKRLHKWAQALRSQPADPAVPALDADLADLMARYPDRQFATTYDKALTVTVDPLKARCSTWYELFPRSCLSSSSSSSSSQPQPHGSFKSCAERLPDLAAMGFDVLYLPPIHPIGQTHRKGKNNTLTAEPDDVGSPWAIGADAGGHKSVHPQLGTLEDFRYFVAQAKEFDIDVALDIAFQCSPDHPYVKAHPEWFRQRPDGSIQYAENPPKKYQDIYPFDFETTHWQSPWDELKSIFEFWIEQGVRIFRVDNPHTKSFPFWEWCIGELKQAHPDTLFLAEAFTRPKVMYNLAKLGFTQSYTYFTWRHSAWEFETYFTELTQTDVRDYFRPNLWPNTPDILIEQLQTGGRPAFMMRLVLAATLSANYGIYGPAFELCEHRPMAPGSEEYLNSEKYEIKCWDLDRAESLRAFITRVNHIRNTHAALRHDWYTTFHPVDNEHLLCYSKTTDDKADRILVVVNLSPAETHCGWVNLNLDALGLGPDETYQVHDLLCDARYQWHGAHNYVELNPYVMPAHIFCINCGSNSTSATTHSS